MSPWSIIRTRSEPDNLLTLDSLDGYMLKYWWSGSERAADDAESLPHANSEKKTRLTAGKLGKKAGFIIAAVWKSEKMLLQLFNLDSEHVVFGFQWLWLFLE